MHLLNLHTVLEYDLDMRAQGRYDGGIHKNMVLQACLSGSSIVIFKTSKGHMAVGLESLHLISLYSTTVMFFSPSSADTRSEQE